MPSTAVKVALCAVAATAAVATTSDATMTFDDYTAEHGKDYVRGSSEWAMRKTLFEKAQRDVVQHNAGKHMYTKGINRFSDWTTAELQSLRGARPSMARTMTAKPRGTHVVRSTGANAVPLPKYVDWRNNKPSVVTAVKNQGYCGSCWAHAVTESVESHWAIATGKLMVLSQQQVVSCTQNPKQCGGNGGCAGALPELGYEYITSTGGITEEWEWSYTSFYGDVANCSAPPKSKKIAKIDGYTAVTRNDQRALMDAVAFAGPLSVLVDASHWPSYTGGILDACKPGQNISLDHAVQVVGYGHDIYYGVDYWLVRNSWSAVWGEEGYVRVLKRAVEPGCVYNVEQGENANMCAGPTDPQVACGMCGILYSPVYPNALPPKPKHH